MQTSERLFGACHSRAGGNPVPLLFKDLKSLDLRLRGDDGLDPGFVEMHA